MEYDVRNKLAFLVIINIHIFQISEVQSPFFPRLPHKSVLACIYRKVLRTWISAVTFAYTLLQEEKGSLASTGWPALKAIHWHGKWGAVQVPSATKDMGTRFSSYLGVVVKPCFWVVWLWAFLAYLSASTLPSQSCPTPEDWAEQVSYSWTPTASNLGCWPSELLHLACAAHCSNWCAGMHHQLEL